MTLATQYPNLEILLKRSFAERGLIEQAIISSPLSREDADQAAAHFLYFEQIEKGAKMLRDQMVNRQALYVVEIRSNHPYYTGMASECKRVHSELAKVLGCRCGD